MTLTSQTVFNYDRLLPTTLGFGTVFTALDNAAHILNNNSSFPPVNIVKLDEYNFIVELAVAGYKRDQIEIEVEKNSLKVRAAKVEDDERNYLARGIARRAFSRQFVLSDTVVVKGAELADGILSISVENVIPEEQKPRKIDIK
jgi:molecular chaperone IbpA